MSNKKTTEASEREAIEFQKLILEGTKNSARRGAAGLREGAFATLTAESSDAEIEVEVSRQVSLMTKERKPHEQDDEYNLLLTLIVTRFARAYIIGTLDTVKTAPSATTPETAPCKCT